MNIKSLIISAILIFTVSPNAFSQTLDGYNGFDFGMSKDAALFICDVRDYFVDTNFTYDGDAQIPPTLSESFIYYSDSIIVNEDTIGLDVTLYFDNFNGDKLFNVDVSIKHPMGTISEANNYFDVIFGLMKEKYGRNYRYSDQNDTLRIVNDLFKRKFKIYDWDLDNGRVSLEHDVSSFYELDEDFYYTNKLKENGFLEITLYYFDTDMFYKFMNSKSRIEDTENEDLKRKL